MDLQETLKELEALGSEKMRAHNRKHGAGDNQFGVKMGDIRTVAKKIKTDHELALALWATENTDARFLAILVLKPKSLSSAELERMVKAATFTHLSDWLTSYVIKQHPDKEALRQKWMTAKDKMTARAGWSLTAERIGKNPQGLAPAALLDRIEAEMPTAPAEVQWTMNYTLASIGIHLPEFRERAMGIGERLGIYRDYPVSKGCTSPFAPIWINYMVNRQKKGTV